MVHNIEENRIVCFAPQFPFMYFIGEFQTNSDGTTTHLDTNTSLVEYPPKVKLNTFDDLVNYIEHIAYDQYQGLVAYIYKGGQDPAGNQNIETIKIYNECYKELQEIRGNEYNLDFRYFQLRNEKEVEILRMMYPEKESTFDEFESILEMLARKINKGYIDRYINKKLVELPQLEYRVMDKCFKEYKCSRVKGEKSYHSIENVVQMLDRESAEDLYKMCKPYITNE